LQVLRYTFLPLSFVSHLTSFKLLLTCILCHPWVVPAVLTRRFDCSEIWASGSKATSIPLIALSICDVFGFPCSKVRTDRMRARQLAEALPDPLNYNLSSRASSPVTARGCYNLLQYQLVILYPNGNNVLHPAIRTFRSSSDSFPSMTIWLELDGRVLWPKDLRSLQCGTSDRLSAADVHLHPHFIGKKHAGEEKILPGLNVISRC